MVPITPSIWGMSDTASHIAPGQESAIFVPPIHSKKGSVTKMSDFHQPLEGLFCKIEDCVRSGTYGIAKIHLNTLATQIVDALIKQHPDEIRMYYNRIIDIYSNIKTAHLRDQRISDVQVVISELDTYARFLIIAQQRWRPPDGTAVALRSPYRPILDALLSALGKGMSGKELAKRLGVAESVIARKLAVLRAAGMIEAKKSGKLTVNTLTRHSQILLHPRGNGGTAGP